MNDPTVVGWEPLPFEHQLPRREQASSRVFNPLTYGVIMLVACVCGIVAILGAQPFASMAATERISNAIGHPATCAEVGMSVAGELSGAVYRCKVGSGKHRSIQC